MMADMSSKSVDRSTTRTVLPVVAHVLVGVVTGMLLLYLVSIAANIPSAGGFTVPPVALVALALVGGAAVVVGWRWPTVGLVAGLVILALVTFAVATRIAWLSSGAEWLNPFNAIGFGAASGYPTLVGAVLVVLCALRLSVRSRQ